MKHWIASVLLTAPFALMAATTTSSSAPAKAAAASKAKSAATSKAPAKPSSAKSTAAKPASAKAAQAKSATAGKAAAAGAAVAGTAVAARALNADELALAERVHTGRIACELGQHVDVAKDAGNPGHFVVTGKGFNFHMAPVGTSTGVVRLEDAKAGAVWLQIANKSMLMNQKQGKRLADECMSPEQMQVAEAIKKSPPPSLLEAPKN